jgi:hypothetical protein
MQVVLGCRGGTGGSARRNKGFGTAVWTSPWGVLTYGRPGLALVVLSVVEQWLDASAPCWRARR